MTLRPSLRRFYIEKFMSIMNLQLEGEPDGEADAAAAGDDTGLALATDEEFAQELSEKDLLVAFDDDDEGPPSATKPPGSDGSLSTPAKGLNDDLLNLSLGSGGAPPPPPAPFGEFGASPQPAASPFGAADLSGRRARRAAAGRRDERSVSAR